MVAAKVFADHPTAAQVCATLDAAVRSSGRPPRHIISDQGSQFRDAYRKWCTTNDSKPRFGAVGKHGSIAVIERFWRSMKDECFRRIIVPFSTVEMRTELALYVQWYNSSRPHQALHGATPREILERQVPACNAPGLETRPRFPLARGHPKKRISRMRLVVTHLEGRPHLPQVELRDAA